jgi:hypothetical protein
VQVTLHELRRLESRELERLLGEHGLIQESDPLGDNRQGDAAVFNLIVNATPYVAGVIGFWLLKPRKGKTFRLKLTGTDDSSKLREADIYLHEYASESPTELVVNALSKFFGFGTDAVKKAIDDASANQQRK